jgi:hypothetical protein
MRVSAAAVNRAPGLRVTTTPEGGTTAMRWFKVAAFAIGVLIAFLVVSSLLGFLVEVAIAALIVGVGVLAIKVAFYRKQVSWKGSGRQVRGPRDSGPQRRHNTPDVDDELTRLKREMGG